MKTQSSNMALKLLLIPLMVIPLLLFMTTSVRRQDQMTLDVNPLVLPFSKGVNNRCDVCQGKWMPHDGGMYYTNSSCPIITDLVNCIKFGRPDLEFLKLRWKPDGCELPKLDAHRFLELVRGKAMAFVGDSLGRNQMLSLQCILAGVDYPEDISDKHDPSFPRWYFPRYDFTVAAFWAPFLMKSSCNDSISSATSTVNLHLDKPDASWASEIGNFDFVIISAGHWLFHQNFVFHEKGRIIGCSLESCDSPNATALFRFNGIRKVFRTTFETLMRKRNYKGITFLRTFSPQHYENGSWDNGGTCGRIRPVSAGETSLLAHEAETYSIQVEEFRAAKEVARKRGLKFWLLDTTGMMLMRPDGHPNFYGHSPYRKANTSDCVHWCLPGPIDTWNELLQYYLIAEDEHHSV